LTSGSLLAELTGKATIGARRRKDEITDAVSTGVSDV
jgi:hypothetical protein